MWSSSRDTKVHIVALFCAPCLQELLPLAWEGAGKKTG